MNGNWITYFERVKNQPPHPTLVSVVESLGTRGEALDVGSGTGRDTVYLLQEGFAVTAVDSSKDSLMYLNAPTDPNLEVVISDIVDFDFKSYDLVNAFSVLSFLSGNDFDDVVHKIIASLNSGGIFVGNFFGPKDEWNVSSTKKTFVDEHDLKKYFADTEILLCKEQYEIQEGAAGKPKQWHLFTLVARKP